MYISNHWSNLETTQKFIEHIHALSKNLSGEICFTGWTKYGLVDYLLVNSQK